MQCRVAVGTIAREGASKEEPETDLGMGGGHAALLFLWKLTWLRGHQESLRTWAANFLFHGASPEAV